MSEPIYWHDTNRFWFNNVIQSNWEKIRDEIMPLLEGGLFVDHNQSEKNTKSEYTKIANDWRVFKLYTNLYKHERNIELTPFTWSIISKIPDILTCPHGLVYFSLIPAGGVVKPHISMLEPEDRIRHQLCLKIPELKPTDKVFMDICGEKRGWELGKTISFNDAYRHSVKNGSSGSRLVLIYDSIYS